MAELGSIFAEHGPVEELEIDDAFLEHLRKRGWYAEHSVRLAEILQVHSGRPRYFLNATPPGDGAPPRPRRAPVVMVGPTALGRFVTVPIEPTGRYGIWHPVTAFQSNTHHRERYLEGEPS